MPIVYAVVAAIALFIGGAGYSLVTNYSSQAAQLQQAQYDAELIKRKLESYTRMVDRRDAAISASKCADQIKHWVSNPDEIPKKFDPFNSRTGN